MFNFSSLRRCEVIACVTLSTFHVLNDYLHIFLESVLSVLKLDYLFLTVINLRGLLFRFVFFMSKASNF